RSGDRCRRGVDDGPRRGDDHPRRARARPHGEHGRRAARGGSDPGGAADLQVLGSAVADAAVNYAATLPGPRGPVPAFLGELAISFGMMTVVLVVSNSRRARLTGLFAGLLVATYISVEAPLSGMSMNPARTLGSAVHAGQWTALWVYFTAPPLGMLAAAEVYLRLPGAREVWCAKLHHDDDTRCLFL